MKYLIKYKLFESNISVIDTLCDITLDIQDDGYVVSISDNEEAHKSLPNSYSKSITCYIMGENFSSHNIDKSKILNLTDTVYRMIDYMSGWKFFIRLNMGPVGGDLDPLIVDDSNIGHLGEYINDTNLGFVIYFYKPDNSYHLIWEYEIDDRWDIEISNIKSMEEANKTLKRHSSYLPTNTEGRNANLRNVGKIYRVIDDNEYWELNKLET